MSDSEGEGSAPPDVQGDAVPTDGAQATGAAAAAPTAPTHPVWAAAAGCCAGSRSFSAWFVKVSASFLLGAASAEDASQPPLPMWEG